MNNLLVQNETINLPINPSAGFGGLISFGFDLFMVIAGLLVFFYMLWGALDWILSGGDKEKLDKAKRKIINAVIGLILIVVLIAVWYNLVGPILGIFEVGEGGFSIKLPSI